MSKLMMFDFLCDRCGEMFERLVESDKHEYDCPDCGAVAKRVISPVNFDTLHMGVSGDMPTFTDKWDKMRREKAKLERKQES